MINVIYIRNIKRSISYADNKIWVQCMSLFTLIFNLKYRNTNLSNKFMFVRMFHRSTLHGSMQQGNLTAIYNFNKCFLVSFVLNSLKALWRSQTMQINANTVTILFVDSCSNHFRSHSLHGICFLEILRSFSI